MRTGIQITAKYYLLQWILWFIKPKISINNEIHNIRWGTNFISIKEGDYLVEVYFIYFFGKSCLGQINLSLNNNETIKLYYHTPLFVFSAATLRIEGQSTHHQSKQSKPSTYPPTTSTQQPVTNTPAPSPIKSKKEYFVHIDDKQLGPYDLEKIKLLIELDKINGDTLIWTEGMKEWEKSQNNPEINKLLS